jgi:hypothetical protein
VSGTTFVGPVALTLNNLDGSVRQTMGSVNQNGSATATISTSGLSQGTYTFVVRGTATYSDATGSHTVSHLYPFTINVNPQSAPGSDTYVDIIGYAAMKITDTSAPNVVWAEAITPVVTSLDDPALDIVQDIRLLPWDYSP